MYDAMKTKLYIKIDLTSPGFFYLPGRVCAISCRSVASWFVMKHPGHALIFLERITWRVLPDLNIFHCEIHICISSTILFHDFDGISFKCFQQDPQNMLYYYYCASLGPTGYINLLTFSTDKFLDFSSRLWIFLFYYPGEIVGSYHECIYFTQNLATVLLHA